MDWQGYLDGPLGPQSALRSGRRRAAVRICLAITGWRQRGFGPARAVRVDLPGL